MSKLRATIRGLTFLTAWLGAGCSSADRHAPAPQSLQRRPLPSRPLGGLSLEGDMNYIVRVTTATTSPEKFVSVYHPDTGACSGPGFLDLPGMHELTWEPASGGRCRVQGKAYIGVRRDSPDLLDFALIVDAPEEIPPEMSAQLHRLRAQNTDSVFASSSFPLAARVAWLCKIRQRSARVEAVIVNRDETRRCEILQPVDRTFVDW